MVASYGRQAQRIRRRSWQPSALGRLSTSSFFDFLLDSIHSHLCNKRLVVLGPDYLAFVPLLVVSEIRVITEVLLFELLISGTE